jgi:transcriptional regulator with PAS, ATPase and Fis domain
LDAEQRVVSCTKGAHALLGTPRTEARAAGHAPRVTSLFEDAPRDLVLQLLRGGALTLRPKHQRRDLRVRAMAMAQGALVTLEDAGPQGDEAQLFHGMWTQSRSMREVFRMIERVAADDETVLVRGETGTGKELVAQALHRLSARAKGPFRAINCAALPANLLESELFGHARGAFTGALKDTPGHVQLAHRGTLFLDEVAELPLELQAKLLRMLETHSVVPVGAREPIPVDVRIVSATHRALRKEIEAGRFRADLMYRLRVIPIFLPPLRERVGDIELLASKLIVEMNPTRRRTIERISPEALAVLRAHAFPGNVRELRNVLSFAYAMGDGPVLLPHELPPELLSPEAPASPTHVDARQTESPEAARIRRALELARGNRQEAATLLGMSRVTLWRRMREFGLADAG